MKYFIVILMIVFALGCGGGTLSDNSSGSVETYLTCDNGSIDISTSPSNGETRTPRNTHIEIVFPDGTSASTFDPANFSVVSASGTIAGSVNVDAGTNSATFVPDDLLAPQAAVFVSILHDACGEGKLYEFGFHFTTGNDPDGVAPKAVASSISSGTVDVALNAQIVVFFDEALAAASVNETTVSLRKGDAAVLGTVSYDSSNHSITFAPTADLDANTSYTLSIAGVTDSAGNGLGGAFELYFTTGEAPDTMPPSAPALSKKADSRATLTWTAPGDDGIVGTAVQYQMRYSVNPILTESDFSLGTPVGGMPLPAVAGTLQEIDVAGMTPGDRRFFALRAVDEAGNESGFASFEMNIAAVPVFGVESLADEDASGYMGYSVAGGCDVNNDGFDDVVVSIPYDDVGAVTNVGSVVVYLGSDSGTIGSDAGLAGLDARTADIVIEGIDGRLASNANDYFGYSVACSGDFNGDGYDDILVGAPYADSYGRTDSGAAYLFYGRDFAVPATIQASNSDVVFSGTATQDYFGWSVNFIGDIDGDGSDEAGAASRSAEVVHTNEGVAYIFYGANTPSGAIVPDAAADITIEGVQQYNNSGLDFIARGGDVDGDGLIDLAFAANAYPAVNRGTAYIYLGKHGYPNYIDLSVDADVTITGEADSDYLGGYLSYPSALAIDGDINGDGIDDIVIGVPYEDTALTDVGAVYAFFGRGDWSALTAPVPSVDADMSITGIAASDYFGISLDTRADFNHDGIQDLLVGGYRFDNGVGGDRGGAFIFYGSTSPVASRISTAAEVVISNEGGLTQDVALPSATLSTSDYWGRMVSAAGDVNADGYGDVVIGGPLNNTAGRPSDAGAAYIIY